MHARSTTVQIRPPMMDTEVARVRDEVMPTVLASDGCVGLSMLVNRSSGRTIVTTAWRSSEAMAAAAGFHGQLPAAVAAGATAEVEDWEIAALHRAHTSAPGAWVRVTWIHVEPEQTDRFADLYRLALLPQIEQFEGFCSASLLLDGPSGHAVSSVTFDAHRAMRNTRALAAGIREGGGGHVDGEVLEVDELELVLAHFRVPELV